MNRKTILLPAAIPRLSVVSTIALLVAAVSPALAQHTLSTLASFDGIGNDGNTPIAGLTLVGNTLYGTTVAGGATGDGTVFSVPITGGTPTMLATFNGSNGSGPEGSLTVIGNTLYGTTTGGGNLSLDGGLGCGTVFSLPITGGTPTALANFNGSDGDTPLAGLTVVGKTLYGTTVFGGPDYNGTYGSGEGTVFSVPISGGAPTTLAAFNYSNGSEPTAGLTVVGNTLYGTTQSGGVGDNGTIPCGTVFSLPTTGGALTTLANFNGSDGNSPTGSLAVIGNVLYGTTLFGGNPSLFSGTGEGTVFSLPITGGTPTTLVDFDGSDGASPCANVVFVGSNLYGTTEYGGDLSLNNGLGNGTVFSLPITGGAPTVLASFNGTDGEQPEGGLVIDAGGNLYGTTSYGGPSYTGISTGYGTVFELSPSSIPEPASLSLLALGSLALLVGGRRRAR
jgi:uncharacterized repeat protein (TIGR03803 family)